MQKAVLTLVVLMSGVSTYAASGLRSRAESIKDSRVEMEKQTELKILEVLEESRIRDEQARMRTIEGTSFNVQPTRQLPTQQPAPQIQTN
ncbi:MAG: hypothetical protein ACKOX6_11955 [Bdellovibrio sp.]